MRLHESGSSSGMSADGLPVAGGCHQRTCSDPPRRRGRDAAAGCSAARRLPKRQLVLLSCSHLFHATCLQAMEEFTEERTQHICPVCRSHYRTKFINA